VNVGDRVMVTIPGHDREESGTVVAVFPECVDVSICNGATTVYDCRVDAEPTQDSGGYSPGKVTARPY